MDKIISFRKYNNMTFILHSKGTRNEFDIFKHGIIQTYEVNSKSKYFVY